MCYDNIEEGRKEGRKEMFYLTTHSTHFILRLYGVGHMVKDHSDRMDLLSYFSFQPVLHD